MTDQNQPDNKLHIDSDWKAQAQAEKERLRRKEEERASEKEQPAETAELPQASITVLIDTLAYQALSGLGIYADKESGGIVVDLPIAKLNIDLMQVLQEKTAGQLTEAETAHLTRMLAELRSRFVQIVQMVEESERRQAGGGGGAEGSGGPDIPTGGSGSQRIITP